MKKLLQFLNNECGATAIEYGFICALIVIGIIVSLQALGQNFVAGPLTTVSTHLSR